MENQRETMEMDVLFVGGGIASLSGAYHLSNLIGQYNERVSQGAAGKRLDEVMIAVLEKGAYVGSHGISGAVMDPVALKELIPDFLEKGAPIQSPVTQETVCFLTEKKRFKFPIIPPPLNNHGNYVVSLSKLVEWLGDLVEKNGVDVFAGFAGIDVLYDGNRVTGIRTDDKGIDADGGKQSNFEPGIDLKAKVTVFGEGSRGSLTKTLIKRFNLNKGKNPDSYELGVKEVWEIPEGRIKPGEVIHTMGYPLKSDTFGGGFIYGMKNNTLSIGQLTSLDYHDPLIDPHREFQKLKCHPFIRDLLKDGKLLQFGAKTVPVGGYYAIPKLVFDGGLIIGDAANLFNSQKIKGIHIAMKSGILAAETIFQGLLKDDFSKDQLESYRAALFDSYIAKDLYRVRNFHQALQKGLYRGMILAGIHFILGGRFIKSRLESKPDFMHLKKIMDSYGKNFSTDGEQENIQFDGELTFDKEADLYYSGTSHREKQSPHLKLLDLDICYNRCTAEYRNPCLRFCPANVYEMEVNEETGKRKMKLNFSNCVHCKTCDVKDPYENIRWDPPEGGGGPKYTMM